MSPSPLSLSRESRRIAGLLLLSIIAVESGGYYLTRVVSGKDELTPFQKAFSRAGHAHAGVLVTLSLIIVVLADVAGLRGPVGYLGRLGVPLERRSSPVLATLLQRRVPHRPADRADLLGVVDLLGRESQQVSAAGQHSAALLLLDVPLDGRQRGSTVRAKLTR